MARTASVVTAVASEGGPPRPSRAKLVLAFATVYVVWGSTYLAIRYAVETFPPLLMSGTRFLVAGGALYAWAVLRERLWGTRAEWRAAAAIGTLLVSAAYGLLSWAEQRIPSGLAALLVASTPAWMVLLEAVGPWRVRPSPLVVSGVVFGFAGQLLLLSPELTRGLSADLVSAGAVLLANVAWALGSLTSRGAHLPASPLLATSMQMLAGGALLVVAGLAAGEWERLAEQGVSARSLLSWLYLVGPGSMAAFTAYVWLLRVTTPARAATYAYVNPVVAVLIGWLIGGERVTSLTLIAAAVTLVAVLMINLEGEGRRETGGGRRNGS